MNTIQKRLGFCPGPWTAEPPKPGASTDSVRITRGATLVASVGPSADTGSIDAVIVANAKLIAGAPQMAETLDFLLDAMIALVNMPADPLVLELADDAAIRIRAALRSISDSDGQYERREEDYSDRHLLIANKKAILHLNKQIKTLNEELQGHKQQAICEIECMGHQLSELMDSRDDH